MAVTIPALAVCLIVSAHWLPAGTAAAHAQPGVTPGAQPRSRFVKPAPGSSGITKPGSTPATKKNTKAAGSDDGPLNLDRESLPPGYVPPRPITPAFTVESEWIYDPFKGDTKARRALELKGKSLRVSGVISNNEDRDVIVHMVRFRLSEMTLKANRDTVHDLRQRFLNELRLTGGQRGSPRDVRMLMLQTIVQDAPRLFEYHLIARINAAILLSEINEFEPDGNKDPIPYVGAATPLMKLLVDDKKQIEAVRIWAVKGLARILQVETLAPLTRYEIVDALVDQLNNSRTSHFWFQMRLAEALGQSRTVFDRNRKPIVPQSLAMVLVDPSRDWIVRAAAAEALGRLPLDGTMNVSLLAVEIARLGQQMTAAYQKESRSDWQLCFIKLYLAFRPVDEAEKRSRLGLLSQAESKANLGAHKKTVQEAYGQVLPLVQNVIRQTPAVLPEAVTKLNDWLKNNEPKDRVLAPGEAPIISKQQVTDPTPMPGAAVKTGGA